MCRSCAYPSSYNTTNTNKNVCFCGETDWYFDVLTSHIQLHTVIVTSSMP